MATNGMLSAKVSEKGAISLYMGGRFPVTLYKEQLENLLDHEKELRAFIKKHVKELKLKPTASRGPEGAEAL